MGIDYCLDFRGEDVDYWKCDTTIAHSSVCLPRLDSTHPYLQRTIMQTTTKDIHVTRSRPNSFPRSSLQPFLRPSLLLSSNEHSSNCRRPFEDLQLSPSTGRRNSYSNKKLFSNSSSSFTIRQLSNSKDLTLFKSSRQYSRRSGDLSKS